MALFNKLRKMYLVEGSKRSGAEPILATGKTSREAMDAAVGCGWGKGQIPAVAREFYGPYLPLQQNMLKSDWRNRVQDYKNIKAKNGRIVEGRGFTPEDAEFRWELQKPYR